MSPLAYSSPPKNNIPTSPKSAIDVASASSSKQSLLSLVASSVASSATSKSVKTHSTSALETGLGSLSDYELLRRRNILQNNQLLIDIGVNVVVQQIAESTLKRSRAREAVKGGDTQQDRAQGIEAGEMRMTRFHAGVIERVNYFEETENDSLKDSDVDGRKRQRVSIVKQTFVDRETNVVGVQHVEKIAPVVDRRIVMYNEPDARTAEIGFPRPTEEGDPELEQAITMFIAQMIPSLGLYGFKTTNIMRFINDDKYDLNPPTTSKPSPYLDEHDRSEKRMRVFTDTMKYLGYSSRKKRGLDEIEWWWDPFRTVCTIFDVCTKENLHLGGDGVFRRTSKSHEWNGSKAPRKASCSIDVKCPTALVELLRKIKFNFVHNRNKKFVERPESGLLSKEKFSAVLDMKEADRYFFPQMRLEYDKYPRLFEMKARDGKIVRMPSVLDLRKSAKERMLVCNTLMVEMFAHNMLVVYGPEQVHSEFLQLEN